ncbi:MAG TPA: hypothetical protein VL727_12085 [Puia sp.]|jgi:hypothetical protein|nr:hypothetical protein [Puia sp.]
MKKLILLFISLPLNGLTQVQTLTLRGTMAGEGCGKIRLNQVDKSGKQLQDS